MSKAACVFVLALCTLATACATSSRTSDQVTQGQSVKPTYQYVALQINTEEVKQATDTYTKCAIEKTAALDDNISPANVIAQSVVIACSKEARALVDAQFPDTNQVEKYNLLTGDAFLEPATSIVLKLRAYRRSHTSR